MDELIATARQAGGAACRGQMLYLSEGGIRLTQWVPALYIVA